MENIIGFMLIVMIGTQEKEMAFSSSMRGINSFITRNKVGDSIIRPVWRKGWAK